MVEVDKSVECPFYLYSRLTGEREGGRDVEQEKEEEEDGGRSLSDYVCV